MLDKLEFLIALDREKHFGRAAESCGVAQPTLSLGLQSLEQMFNVPLVKRSSRFQGFTPEGERVLVWARRMVGDAHAMQQEIAGLRNGIGSHVRLAAVPSAMPIVPLITTPFQLNNPTVRFTVLTRTSDVVIDLLHQREIDVGVTYLDNDPVPDTTTVPLYHEHYLLLTTSDGPRGTDKQIAWAELGSLPLCLFTREMQHRRIVDGLLRGAGVVVTPKAETDSLLALASYVQTGSWASIVPRSMISAMGLSSTMRAIPIVDPDVTHTIGLVVSQRFPAQPAIHSFMQEARARAAELLAIA